MITFIDGPAKGQTMDLARVPFYLRATHSESRGWKALEYPGDTPCPDESLHLYYFFKDTGAVHLDYRDRRTGQRSAKTVRCADYRLCPVQPGDAILRDYTRFHAWCMDHLPEAVDWSENEHSGISG